MGTIESMLWQDLWPTVSPGVELQSLVAAGLETVAMVSMGLSPPGHTMPCVVPSVGCPQLTLSFSSIGEEVCF